MPYRQPWETGHQRAQALRDAATLERARREATAARPNGLRIAAAGLARAAAGHLRRFADGLDARDTRSVPATHASRSVRTRSGNI